jgi:hypothetical protein
MRGGNVTDTPVRTLLKRIQLSPSIWYSLLSYRLSGVRSSLLRQNIRGYLRQNTYDWCRWITCIPLWIWAAGGKIMALTTLRYCRQGKRTTFGLRMSCLEQESRSYNFLDLRVDEILQRPQYCRPIRGRNWQMDGRE